MDRVAVMLEEYKSLRVETIESAKLMQQALSLGLAANGAILGAMATILAKGVFNNDALLPVFFLALPLVSYGTMSFWAGELRRLVRGGVYNAELSEAINRVLLVEDPGSGRALSWEIWLHSHAASPQMVMSYLCSLGVFFALALVSGYIGLAINDTSAVNWLGIHMPFDLGGAWRRCFVLVTLAALCWIGAQGLVIRSLGSQTNRKKIQLAISRTPNP